MSELWYTKPADSFFQALPIGNGSIGAMVYGNVGNEKISFNADTLWSGFPKNHDLPNAFAGFMSARQSMRAGKITEAENTIWADNLGPVKECYLPGGTINICLENIEDGGQYRRSLSLDTAIAECVYTKGDKMIKQIAFCSYPHQILVVHYKGYGTKLRGTITVNTPHVHRNVSKNNYLCVQGIAPYYVAGRGSTEADPIRYDSFENNRALSFAACAAVVSSSGTQKNTPECIHLDDCDEFTLLFHIATNYEACDRQPIDSRVDPVETCVKIIDAALQVGYSSLMASHIQDYNALYSRFELHFDGKDNSHLPTNLRLEEYTKTKDDVGLVKLLFDYGRYLQIASSRPGSRMSNLQGLWNEEMQAPWSSNYTININTQMNDWMTDICNLPECHLPFAEFVCDLSKDGAKTAAQNYHARGWCAHSNSDVWCQTQSAGAGSDKTSVRYGFFYMGGAWLATNLYRHYEYTHDSEYLESVFDTICDAAAFVSDMLVQNKQGQWQTYISTSPENCYILDGEQHAISETTALDISIAQELFDQCINACTILGRRMELAHELTDKRAHLRPIALGAQGQILEWDKDYQEADIHHRHVSHLYGVFPGHSIDLSDPKMRQAVKCSLDRRGEEGTGWSLCWKMCLWATLQENKKVKAYLDSMLRPVKTQKINYDGGGGVYENLLAAHPPFQIDANFGIVTAILQMLLQYKDGELIFLPALPEEFSSGWVRGMCIPGNRQVDFCWKNGKVTGKRIITCKKEYAISR